MNDRTVACTSPFSLMLCFVAGGVAGASVALLLAPQSGRVSREKMRRELNDGAGSAREFKKLLIRRGQKVRNAARHRVDGAVSALSGDRGAKLPG
jgi:gas vesicle protein